MKKPLALILALLLTTLVLVSCAEAPSTSQAASFAVPSFSSSPPSSSILSSAPPSSTISSSSSAPSSSNDPNAHIKILSESDEATVYSYTFDSIFNYTSDNTIIHEGPYTVSVTIPKPYYIDGIRIQISVDEKLGPIGPCIAFGPDMSLANLIAIPENPPSFHHMYDSGMLVLPDGRDLYYLIIESTYNGHGYNYAYIIDLGNGYAVEVIFYTFPPKGHDYNLDRPLFESIMASIQPL